MVTRTEQRFAGLAALATAVALTVSLVLFKGGPRTLHGDAVLEWYGRNADVVQISAITWVLASIGLVVFAVALREALWATVLDRNWVTALFIQGAGVFATIAVVAAAIAWALAMQAQAGTVDAELAGTVWAIERTLLHFATWGFTAPLVVVGLALQRHSFAGQFTAVAGFVIAIGLLVPLTWGAALYAFCGWLVMAGITLSRPTKVVSHHPEFSR